MVKEVNGFKSKLANTGTMESQICTYLYLFLTYVSYVVDVGVGSKTSVDAFVLGILNLDLSPGM